MTLMNCIRPILIPAMERIRSGEREGERVCRSERVSLDVTHSLLFEDCPPPGTLSSTGESEERERTL